MQSIITLLFCTLIFQLIIANKIQNYWIKALISSLTACIILIIINAIKDGAVSNLWPFAFVIFLAPAYAMAIAFHYFFQLINKKQP